jgi:hypothetical protein
MPKILLASFTGAFVTAKARIAYKGTQEKSRYRDRIE